MTLNISAFILLIFVYLSSINGFVLRDNPNLNQTNKRIIIIGAGISGLSAAKELYAFGFENIMILEGMDRIGGRIHTIPHDKAFLELGAQWIHGHINNPTHEAAKVRDLTADDSESSQEGEGLYCTNEGKLLSNQSVHQIFSVLDDISEDIIEGKYGKGEIRKGVLGDADEHKIVRVSEIFHTQFSKYVLAHKNDNNSLRLSETEMWAIYDWYMRYEIIDYASDGSRELEDVSIRSFTEYMNCKGNVGTNFKRGYKSLLDSFRNDFPSHIIHLNKTVTGLTLVNRSSVSNHASGNGNQFGGQEIIVQVEIESTNHAKDNTSKTKETLLADHVIVTSSIGYLKHHYSTLFKSPLPQEKIQIIKTLGFGTINKIFTVFEKPFWDHKKDKGFQLLWTTEVGNNNNLTNKFPDWVRSISGFDVVYKQPNVLVGWFGNPGATKIEDIKDDQEIINVLGNVFRTFLPPNISSNISNPVKIIRSSWATDPFTYGSYSYPSVEFEKTQLDRRLLSSPIMCKRSNANQDHDQDHDNEEPCILFAGEATDFGFYSTTHGALRSGKREAHRIIKWN